MPPDYDSGPLSLSGTGEAYVTVAAAAGGGPSLSGLSVQAVTVAPLVGGGPSLSGVSAEAVSVRPSVGGRSRLVGSALPAVTVAYAGGGVVGRQGGQASPYNHEAAGRFALSSAEAVRVAAGFDGGGQLGLSADTETRVRQVGVLNTTWRVRQTVTGVLNTTWQTGSRPPSWFRVTGKCRPNACPPVAGPACIPELAKRNFVVNVLARNVSEVCEKLVAMEFRYPVAAIEQFSTPAFRSDFTAGTDTSCNALSDVTPDITLVKCQELFLDASKTEVWAAASFFQIAKAYDAVGAIGVRGSSVGNADYAFAAAGGFSFSSGTPPVTSSAWSWGSIGGVALTGSARLALSHWEFEPAGGLVVSAQAPITWADWGWDAQGGIGLSAHVVSISWSPGFSGGYGDGLTEYDWSFGVPRDSQFHASLSGSAHARLGVVASGAGSVMVGGLGVVGRSNWSHIGSGSVGLAGSSFLALGHYTAAMSGPLWVRGGGPFLFQGGFGVGGAALLAVGAGRDAFGGVALGGAAGVISSAFGASGGFSLRGRATAVTNDLGTLWTEIAWADKVPVLGVVYPYVPAPSVSTVVTAVQTPCCPLGLPRTIALDHQLGAAGGLGRFLARNRLTMPSRVGLIYSGSFGGWYESLHYSGYSAAFPTFESWDVVFSLQCLGDPAAAENAYLEFGVLVKYRQPGGAERVTRIRLQYDTSQVCPRGRSLLSFPITLDTGTRAATPAPAGDFVLVDEAGLFKVRPAPRLRFKLTDGAADLQESGVDIGPGPLYADDLGEAVLRG